MALDSTVHTGSATLNLERHCYREGRSSVRPRPRLRLRPGNYVVLSGLGLSTVPLADQETGSDRSRSREVAAGAEIARSMPTVSIVLVH